MPVEHSKSQSVNCQLQPTTLVLCRKQQKDPELGRTTQSKSNFHLRIRTIQSSVRIVPIINTANHSEKQPGKTITVKRH